MGLELKTCKKCGENKAFDVYYQHKKEQLKLVRKSWAKANPEKTRSYWHNRQARKSANGGSHKAADLLKLLQKQDYKCANFYCAVFLKTNDKHPDHKVALARGGSNGIENLQWLCAFCNMSKGARDLDGWLAAQKFKPSLSEARC